MKAENSEMRKDIIQLRNQIQQLEAYTLRDNLRSCDMPDKTSENTEQELKKMYYAAGLTARAPGPSHQSVWIM